MDSVSNILNKMFDSIKDFNNDVSIVVTKKDTYPEAEKLRIDSLAARVTGVFTALNAAGLLVCGLGAVLAGSGGMFLLYGSMFVFSAVLAHDCLKVASNIKQILNVLPESAKPGERFAQTVCRVASGIWNLGKAYDYEATTATPYFLRDTILFAPIHQIATNHSQNNEHARLRAL
jgi:hypothetical protein